VADSTAHPDNKAPMAAVTLWKCSKCSSFISVESIEAVCVTVCPACQHAPLDLCGSFSHLLDLRSKDDTCCDYYPEGW
jgi:DNA-directed RNA polymerase subunit RPC12/RpoP